MYNLHKLGWYAFQQLCSTIIAEVLGQTAQIFSEVNDGGRDGAFHGIWEKQNNEILSGRFVIQCKFTSQINKSLTKSLLNDELKKAKYLVDKGICDVYILMTNMKISGKKEQEIKKIFYKQGVKAVEVYGSEWIKKKIIESDRLRMLVPRVYGLGDLSQILDERAYAQAQAVLDSLRDELAKVVITQAYRQAVSALDLHGFVLLIGEPASGKTTIASMLSMAAADKWKSSVIKLTEPSHIKQSWNPHEPNQFFWIDDAFGVTQYESSLVRDWNRYPIEIKSMLDKGAKIIMTSRDYIYNHAREELKESAFPLFEEGQVVIDVHELTIVEKQQMLYSHLKLGNQPQEFIKRIKPFLEFIAEHKYFIPEIARRLADPFFTKKLTLIRYELDSFIEKREEYLTSIITGLDKDSKAALALIFMNNGRLISPVSPQPDEASALDRLGSSLSECTNALNALKNCLVVLKSGNERYWEFKHPTIGDAFSLTLLNNPELLIIYIQGSSVGKLIGQVTCGDVGIEKAVIIPNNMFNLMINKLGDKVSASTYKISYLSSWDGEQSIFNFLATRCSRDFLSLYLEGNYTKIKSTFSSLYYRGVALVMRLYNYGLLNEDDRKMFIKTIVTHAIQGDNLEVLEDNELQKIFFPDELKDFEENIKIELVPNLDKLRWGMELDYSEESSSPEDYFYDFKGNLEKIKVFFENDLDVCEEVDSQLSSISSWVNGQSYEEPNIEPLIFGKIKNTDEAPSGRSIFDDIDDM